MTRGSSDRIKRLFDLTVGSILLILTSPVQAVVALLVYRDLGAPVLFRQRRPGRDEQVFELVKFRTMRSLGPDDSPLNDGERLTPLGRTLRSTSMDELPSLWNVVKGDMSLVGPRPLLVQYLERYDEVQRRRHEVRPGITGMVQVSGRNHLTWDDKLRLDVEYVDTRSFVLDVKILLKTLAAVFKRAGISAVDSATMPEFAGSSGQQPSHEVATR